MYVCMHACMHVDLRTWNSSKFGVSFPQVSSCVLFRCSVVLHDIYLFWPDVFVVYLIKSYGPHRVTGHKLAQTQTLQIAGLVHIGQTTGERWCICLYIVDLTGFIPDLSK